MSQLLSLMLSLGILVSILLVAVGIAILLRRPDDRRRGWLMLLAGLVTLLNIYLYATLPTPPAG